ncbi:hypothetical protein BH09ACT6_BH09ACT6_20340 [soil metagenome]
MTETRQAPGDAPLAPVLQLVPPGPMLDRLLDAVAKGVKTATSALKVSFDIAGDPLPRRGDRYTLLDSAGSGWATIRVTEVRVLPLVDVGDDVAAREGDWFENAGQWRAAHERFWARTEAELRVATGDPLWTVGDETPVVVRFFELLP